MNVDDAFKGFRDAYAELQAVQERVNENRAKREQAARGTDEWLELDREFTALQKEWDHLHKAFKKETAKFNSVCAETIESLRRPVGLKSNQA
jgi:hypothetical protein